jgi:hypothetical protein
MSASADVPRTDSAQQFLFVGDPARPAVTGFRINQDGSLTPLPGSPFPTEAPTRTMTSVHGTIVTAGETGISEYAVDKESGAIQLTDSVQTGSILRMVSDASASAVYVVTEQGTLGYRVTDGKLQALPASRKAEDFLSSAVKSDSPPAVLDDSARFMYVLEPSKAQLAAFRVDRRKPVALEQPEYPVPNGADSITLVKP